MVPLMEKGNLIPRWIVLYLFFRVALKLITFRNLVNLSLEWLIIEPFLRAFFAFQVYIRHSAPNLGINSTVSIAENINDGLVNRIEVRYLR